MDTVSVMIAVPKYQEDLKDFEGMMNRLANMDGVTLVEHDFNEGLNATIEQDGVKYEMKFYPTEIEIPQLYRVQHTFPDVDIETIQKAEIGLAVELEFEEDVQISYQLQLRLITTLVPGAVAVLDVSSEKILSGKWVELAAESKVLPAPRYIYTVQAIYGEQEDNVWLHTHGMNRCGLPELEILASSKDMAQTHYSIIETLANRLLEMEDVPNDGEPMYLAMVTDQIPLFVTLVDWEEAVEHYPEDMLGGRNDRMESHNEDTSCIFIFATPDDLESGEYSPVFVFDEFLQENPIFMISDRETDRMRNLARERMQYLCQAYKKNPDLNVLIKIGLDVDEKFKEEGNANKEHIWFELLELGENSMKCELTQEPYYVKALHQGSQGTYTFDQITDWMIFTEERRITPDDVYIMGLE